MTAKYGTPYFSNYINSDMNPSDVRSMCPLHPSEKVLVMDDYSKRFHISTVEYLYKGNKKDKEYIVLHKGQTKRARLNRFDGLDFYEIKLSNGIKVKFSGNHQNLTFNGVKTTAELTTEDYLPFNLDPVEGEGLTYEDGLMVGAFLGDGSLKDENTVVYSVNKTTKLDLLNEIIEIAKQKFGGKVLVTDLENNCTNISISSKILRGLIEEFVSGKALNKEINPSAVNMSLRFRRGVIDGYQRTDGGNRSRIYTSSEKMVETFGTVLASAGIPFKVSVDDRGSDKTYSENPVYTIKMYITDKDYGDIFKFKDNYMWFRIEEITKLNSTGSGYCFEVLGDEEPYFMLPSGLVTHNCRLRLDLRELRHKNGGFFGSGESTGSIGVVTINLPQIAYFSENESDFYNRLDKLMDIAARSLDTKRRVVSGLLERGLYPYTKAYLGSFDNHFSTIGLVGMNETCLNAKWIGKSIASKEGKQFAQDVLNHMRNRLSDYQEKYAGTLFNLEATPAESTAYRFAKWDREHFPGIITAGTDLAPYYTNSSNLPVDYTGDVFEALDHQDDLQTLYTSGTVFHTFLGERLPDWKAAAKLVKTIAENYRLPYYSISPAYSVCPTHGYIKGKKSVCPHCGAETEIYERITGYYRPVKNWNVGKTQEEKERKAYTEMSRDFSSSTNNASTNADISVNPEEITIITTETCPRCKQLKSILDSKGVRYSEILATTEEGSALCEKLHISTAPTVLYHGTVYPQMDVLRVL